MTSPTSRARTAQPLPQLGSVALQSGVWAAKNLLADFAGEPPQPFHYKDKGIMAMIGRGSAIAAMGPRRREVHGPIAFAAWLGVHAHADDGCPRAHARLHRLGWGERVSGPAVPR